MGTPTIWSKLRELLEHIVWIIFCRFVLGMTEEKYYSLDECLFCGTGLIKDENGVIIGRKEQV